MTPLPEEWLSEELTLERLGITDRTLRRMVAEGKGPERRKIARPGKKPAWIYSAADVQRIIDEAGQPPSNPDTAVVRVSELSTSVTELSGVASRLAAEFAARLGEEMRRGATVPQPAPPPKIWLTILEAAEYTGLSAAFVRRQIREGRVPALRDGGWKIHYSHLATLAKPVSGCPDGGAV